MSLDKLGVNQTKLGELEVSAREDMTTIELLTFIAKQLKTLNNFMALLTDVDEPPTRDTYDTDSIPQ